MCPHGSFMKIVLCERNFGAFSRKYFTAKINRYTCTVYSVNWSEMGQDHFYIIHVIRGPVYLKLPYNIHCEHAQWHCAHQFSKLISANCYNISLIPSLSFLFSLSLLFLLLLVVVQYSGRLRTGSHALLLQYNGRTVSCLFIEKIILTSSSIWVGLKWGYSPSVGWCMKSLHIKTESGTSRMRWALIRIAGD